MVSLYALEFLCLCCVTLALLLGKIGVIFYHFLPVFTRLAVPISSKNSWPKHHQNGNAITHGCTKILKNYGTLHFRCLFLTEKYKKRLYPEFTKALHQPQTLTIQDDTLSSLLILVSSEVSFF